MTTAHDILQAAAGHMQDRAATYDKPEGERSMGATVEAFKAVTGHCLTEEQGWLFMALLKAVRSQQGAHRADSYEDGAAYFALAGEAAARDRTRPAIRELYTEEDEKRMDVVGSNGNDGEHYWHTYHGVAPDLAPGTRIMIECRNGVRESGEVREFDWRLVDNDSGRDIIRWRLA